MRLGCGMMVHYTRELSTGKIPVPRGRKHSSLLMTSPTLWHNYGYKPPQNLGDCEFWIANWLVGKNPQFAIRNPQYGGFGTNSRSTEAFSL